MSSPPGEQTLDLSLLREHTSGDRALEVELLTLFEAQCLKLFPVIAGSLDPRSRGEAAHSLRGGAAAIGAGEVVRLSAAIEEANGECAQGDAAARLVGELAAAIAKARMAIAARRGDA